MNELLWPLSMRTHLWESRDAIHRTFMNESGYFVVDTQTILWLMVLATLVVLFRIRKSRGNCYSSF